jgi:ABC-type Fe3+/spermidine/putrescine transport system ATPase subunit
MSATAGPPVVRVRGLAKSYGRVPAVHPLDLDIGAGEFCVILGPSGCGKSTLLRMLAGFVAPTAGRIEIDGRDVTGLGPEQRPTNMVFQSYGLFPHMTVAGNVAFGLVIARRPRTEIEERVRQALALVRLEAFADRPVDRLSGGQQQRVALARALVMRPRVLLLDEPLSALDLKLRQAMQEELRRIHAVIGGTFVVVTHDQNEAFHLADRIVVMHDGRIEQEGSPEDVYRAPRSLFAAGFVGEMNVLHGRRAAGRIEIEAGGTLVADGADGPVTIMVRPEALRFAVAEADGGRPLLEGRVVDAIFVGSGMKYVLETPAGTRVRLLAAAEAERRAVGSTARVTWDPDRQQVLSAA